MNPLTSPQQRSRYALGLTIWLLGWGLLLLLDTHLDLANMSLVLVLTSALAALWLPVSITLLASVIALMAFNWAFVPPRGTFAIDLHQHALLLLAMLAVNVIVAGLMVSLREQSRRAQAHAEAADTLRRWGDQLRDAEQPQLLLADLHSQLLALGQHPVAIAIKPPGADSLVHAGDPVAGEQAEALNYAISSGQALGPGTGRYQELSELYLPLRGRSLTAGAVLLPSALAVWPERVAQAQALCDQMGLALERHEILAQQRRARDQAQAQNLRNTFLAAIAHDYRTPLATIMSAASSLQQQDERLQPAQRQQLAASIMEEADRLSRQTNNMLQLARLDGLTAVGAAIAADWESLEEIVGTVMRRCAAHPEAARVQLALQSPLPLVWGDALLLALLLDNLIDNALKYSPAQTPIVIVAALDRDWLVLGVIDQGAGIPAGQYEQMFAIFQRGDQRQTAGAGVGLALCRAIAQAHGGELVHYCAADGAHFECRLPLRAQPVSPEPDL